MNNILIINSILELRDKLQSTTDLIKTIEILNRILNLTACLERENHDNRQKDAA